MYVGLSKDDEIIDFTQRVSRQDHAKYLVDRIDNILKRNQLTLDDVDEMIIGIGPGSYTGIRICVMVAKMLAYTKNIKLKTVSSLHLLTSGYQGNVCAMIDARRGYVFAHIHDEKQTLLEDSYISLNELSQMDIYKKSKAYFISDETYKVDISRVIEISKRVEDVHNLVPNYLRQTEAENNL